MTEPAWTLDPTFQVDGGNVIQALQRPLTDPRDVKANERAPFVELRSLFKFIPQRHISGETIVKGMLSALTVSANGQTFAVTEAPPIAPGKPSRQISGRLRNPC